MENVDKKDTRLVLFRLLKYAKGHVGTYIGALALMCVSVACELSIPYVLGVSIRMIGETEINIKGLIIFNICCAIAYVLKSIAQYFQTYLLNKNGNIICYEIRNECLAHIQTLSHNQFHGIPTGKLVTRVTSDINVIYEFFTNILVSLLRYVISIIGIFTMMFILNVQLTIIVLCIVPVVAVFCFIFSKLTRKIHRKVRENVSNMNAFLSENISGIKVTQVFNQEDKKYREFQDNNNILKKSLLKEIFTWGIFRPTVYVMYIATIGLVLYFGGLQAIDLNLGIVSVGVTFDLLFTFTQYTGNLFGPVQELADQINELQSALASAEKVFSILDMESEIKDDPDAIDITLTGDIEFKGVWFSYVPGDWILKGVSFHIHPQDTIAFVGATGAGKTTILSLIVRNYDIQKGQILIDGVDIKKIKLSSLRSQIGQMLQDVFLFSGNIEDNITMCEPEITHDMVVESSTYVNASKFIDKLPDGYNTEVRERGENFSLGQRQLISFARTIITKPNLMILDEATSNIDTETEILIQDSLNKILKMGTVIVVAHRLSTIQHCKHIYVFSDGQIIEHGNHQELLAQHGRYYYLYKLQFSEDRHC